MKNKDGIATIDGVRYQGFNVGGSTWMIKKLLRGDDFSNQANYVEAEISVNTQDVEVAIRAAIDRGSWA